MQKKNESQQGARSNIYAKHKITDPKEDAFYIALHDEFYDVLHDGAGQVATVASKAKLLQTIFEKYYPHAQKKGE